MKDLLKIPVTVIVFMVCTISLVYSQIMLDHTYSGWASVANLSVSGYKYHVLDTQTETLKLYNTDHSLWKTVNLSVPSGYTLMTNVYNVSENLFSLDGKVGFSYSYYTTTPSYTVETKVINENGTVLLTIAGANYAYAYDVDGEAKLLAYITNYTNNTYTTKVYDLPGTLISGFSPETSDRQFLFPNPAENYITISYPRDEIGNDGYIILFDMSGKCVKAFKIDKNFSNLKVDTKTLIPGCYLYSIRNSEEEIEGGKIIIQ